MKEEVIGPLLRQNGVAYVVFTKDLKNNDNLILHCTSEVDKNANGLL